MKKCFCTIILSIIFTQCYATDNDQARRYMYCRIAYDNILPYLVDGSEAQRMQKEGVKAKKKIMSDKLFYDLKLPPEQAVKLFDEVIPTIGVGADTSAVKSCDEFYGFEPTYTH